MVEAWRLREWREESRFAKLMYLVAKCAGSDCELSDFLPPKPGEPQPDKPNLAGQHALNAYLKSCLNSK